MSQLTKLKTWLDEHEGWNRTMMTFQKSIPLAEVSLVSEKRKLIHHADLSKVIAIIAVASASSFFCYLICLRVRVRPLSFAILSALCSFLICWCTYLVLCCLVVSASCLAVSSGFDRCTRTAVETEKSSSHSISCFSPIV